MSKAEKWKAFERVIWDKATGKIASHEYGQGSPRVMDPQLLLDDHCLWATEA